MGPSAWEKRGGTDARLFVSLPNPARIDSALAAPTSINPAASSADTISKVLVFRDGRFGRKTLPPTAVRLSAANNPRTLQNYAKQPKATQTKIQSLRKP